MSTATARRGEPTIELLRLRELWGHLYSIDFLGGLWHAQRRADGAKPFKAISPVVMLEMIFGDFAQWEKEKKEKARAASGMMP